MTNWETVSDTWVYVYECIDKDTIELPTHPPDVSDSIPDIQTVYRPVYVEQNDDGERRAYYYDPDAEPEKVLKDGGKNYVPMQHVHRTPPTNADPAYKYE